MPPTVALLLTLGFIAFLFRRDFREKANVTGALWLPTLWMLIICSRPISAWLRIFGIHLVGARDAASAYEEGNPVDAAVFFALIALGFYVLSKRKVRLSEILRDNAWLAVFFLYCFLAIFWSDFPLVSFKRWIKILGHPIMVLVLFTEPDPLEAVARLMKRCAYIIVPVSIMFIKYFPQWGRRFDESGEAMSTGVTNHKNALGCVSMILGLFLFWHLLQLFRKHRSIFRRNEPRLILFFLLMIGYLLRKSHSATSTISLFVAASVICILGLRVINKRTIGVYVGVGIFILVLAQLTFDIFGSIVELTGHGDTIEGRSELWRELLEFDTDPILGTGFESFWLGERLQSLWDAHWWHPNEAHNGYLETYLSLGGVGLLLVIVLITATFAKCRNALLETFEWGRFRMGFLVALVIYNWTEAAFKGLSAVWFVFYIIAMDYTHAGGARIQDAAELPESETDEDLNPVGATYASR